MSTSKVVSLLMVVLAVTISYVEAKKILRAKTGVETTGNYMIVLSLDTSDERFREIESYVGVVAAGEKIHSLNGRFSKIITTKLSEEALQRVSPSH